MDTAAVDYDLPQEAIAQTPVDTGDVVVVNTTRVLPARLRARRPTGGAVEVLLLEPRDGEPDRWDGLVRPSRKVRPGTRLAIADELSVVVHDDLGEGRRVVELVLSRDADLLAVLERHGTVPLPPYITAPLADPERYQTTYAERPASVAAPTAGLHLTPALLDDVRAKGARVVPVDLVVGLGTFRPIATDQVEEHHMHAERYSVPEATMEACRDASRVVAVGTTTVRALESAVATGELQGRTELFIHGDRPFAVVDALVTNFHQPRSSLLVLVEAFVGPRWRPLYEEALASGYRFLSFGDAMYLRGERG